MEPPRQGLRTQAPVLRLAVAVGDTTFQRRLRRALRGEWRVDSYGQWGAAANRLAAAARPPPDLLFLSGSNSTRRSGDCVYGLLRLRPQLPVVAVVSPFRPHLVLRSLLAGAISCLVSPVSAPELRLAATMAVRGRAMLNAGAQDALVRCLQRAGRSVTASRLTQRESELITLLAARDRNKAIAQALHISPGTVHVHLAHVFEKLGVPSRGEAVRTALGLVPDRRRAAGKRGRPPARGGRRQ